MNSPDKAESLPLQPKITEELAKPIVVYALLGVTIVLYIAQLLSERFLGFDFPAALGMKINENILAGEYWRLITPALLHGSAAHIAFNMYALYVIGTEIEKRFGHARFGLIYLVGALGGNTLSFLMSPNPSLGASTSIFALLGAEIVFFYQNRGVFGQGAKRALQNVISVAVINLIIGLSPGIDNYAHLGGLIAGLLFTALAGPILAVEGVFPNFAVIDRRSRLSTLWAVLANMLLFSVMLGFKI